MPRAKTLVAGVVALASATFAIAWVSPAPVGMHEGPVAAKSLGQMAFGPNNVLFVGDNDAGAIHAIQIEDAGKPGGAINIDGIDTKVAQALGVAVTDIALADMAVHPVSHNVYLTVRRGAGADMKWILLRVTASATNPIEEVPLDNVKFSTASIANVPASTSGGRNPRNAAITDIAFADGKVWVAGLSNEEFSSAFRQLAYPFGGSQQSTSLEIYHWAHKKSETQSPVMTFTPVTINGKLNMVAAYTCTPLVAFDASGLANGQKVLGRTVADLGAGNAPYDIVAYTTGGQDYVLVANRNHAMMKVSVADIATGKQLSPDTNDGIPRKNVSAPGAVTQLANFDANNVIVVQKSATGGFDLRTIAKSTF
jgi:hypothetical protein